MYSPEKVIFSGSTLELLRRCAYLFLFGKICSRYTSNFIFFESFYKDIVRATYLSNFTFIESPLSPRSQRPIYSTSFTRPKWRNLEKFFLHEGRLHRSLLYRLNLVYVHLWLVDINKGISLTLLKRWTYYWRPYF